MKKTLTLVASLAFGTSVSQAAVLCSTTFDRTGTSLNSVTVNTTSDVGLTSSSSISPEDFSKSNTGADLVKGSVPSSVFSPNTNVGASGNNTWSVSFTFTNTGSQDMMISSIDLTMIGFTSTGVAQNGGNGVANNGYVGGYDGDFNKPIDMTLSIQGQQDQMLTYNGSTAASGNSGSWNGSHTGSYYYGDLLLGAGDSLTLTITASNNSNYTKGCFIGIEGIQIKGDLVVPEPATASLGLLGMAALMMRRRRV